MRVGRCKTFIRIDQNFKVTMSIDFFCLYGMLGSKGKMPLSVLMQIFYCSIMLYISRKISSSTYPKKNSLGPFVLQSLHSYFHTFLLDFSFFRTFIYEPILMKIYMNANIVKIHFFYFVKYIGHLFYLIIYFFFIFFKSNLIKTLYESQHYKNTFFIE